MIIIFSGYNQRAVISFLRTLEKNGVKKYEIIAESKNDTILLTSYASKVKFVRKNKNLSLKEILHAIDSILEMDNEKGLLIPSTEALNRFLLQNRDEIEAHNCVIPLVEQSLYQLISDKETFWVYCQNKGLCVPRKIEIQKENIPFVAKPKKYFGQDGKVYVPVIVKTEAEYQQFRSTYNEEDFMYQEYVWGESFYLLFYFKRNGEVYKFSQVNYAQQPSGKSIVMARCSNIHLKDSISDMYEKLFQNMGYFGFVMVELRYKNGKYYMIEANPRFWGPSQLFCNAGYNLFEVFLEEYGYLDDVSLENIDYNAKYLWSGGIEGDFWENTNCVWYGDGKEEARKNMEAYLVNDIYNREDTKRVFLKEKADNEKVKLLKELYMKSSKHSNYQVLPSGIRSFLGEDLVINSRYEEERLKYIINKIDMKGKKVLDIGGNTGFFTLKSCELGAEFVEYYEGNDNHARFVQCAADLLGIEQKVKVNSKYYTFDQVVQKYDITYCLNVVHHLGSDFGKETKKEEAKLAMLKCINHMAEVTDYLIFQMGYNWCGNTAECLFEHGTKEEMEEFVVNGTAEYWNLIATGVAVQREEGIVYEDIIEENNKRDDKMGEFLNRPIFIMKSNNFTNKRI